MNRERAPRLRQVRNVPAYLMAVLIVAGCRGIPNKRGLSVREVDPRVPGTPWAGTGPESQDVLAAADKMTQSLLTAPVIARAEDPPTVVLLNFRNRSRFPINADIFLKKLRVQLNSSAAGNMIFLGREKLDAVAREREAKRQGFVSASADKRQELPAGADYFLTGSIDGLAKQSSRGKEDYLLYTYQLIDAESSAVVWEDQFEIKRVGLDDAVYR